MAAFSYFQFYCFEQGDLSIPSLDEAIMNSTTITDFIDTAESFAAAGCQYTSSLRDFISSNAAWFDYQKETWLAMGEYGTGVIAVVWCLVFRYCCNYSIIDTDHLAACFC